MLAICRKMPTGNDKPPPIWGLTRMFRQLPAAVADPLVLRGRAPSGRLDVPPSTPSPPCGPRGHAERRLDALATKVGEICGLIQRSLFLSARTFCGVGRISRRKRRTPITQSAWRSIGLLGLLLTGLANAEVELVVSVDRVLRLATADGEMETLLVDASTVQPGQELRYTIAYTNASDQFIDPGIVVITNAIPESAEYIEGSATGARTEIQFSVDNGAAFGFPESLIVVEGGSRIPASARHYTTIRWTVTRVLGPGEGGSVSFDVRLREEMLPTASLSSIPPPVLAEERGRT